MFRPRPQPESLLTDAQRTFADGVRERLRRAPAVYAERIEATSAEAWYSFHVETPSESALRVKIAIISDVFAFVANGAEVRRDLVAWDDDTTGWIRECLDILDALLQSELRIRVRRTLFGGTRGAIWVPAGDGEGAWSGDLAACQGKGREHTFPRNWYTASAT